MKPMLGLVESDCGMAFVGSRSDCFSFLKQNRLVDDPIMGWWKVGYTATIVPVRGSPDMWRAKIAPNAWALGREAEVRYQDMRNQGS